MKHNALFLTAVGMLLASQTKADVIDSAANGFTVKLTLSVQAPPAEVYRKLLNAGDWWSSAHTFSGNSHNLSIEEKAMGCFCEKLPNNGMVRHMEVVFLAPAKTLVMIGALGPLQSMAATGSMTIQLSPADAGTKIAVTYAVTGYFPAGTNTWSAPLNSVVTEQFTRLKNLIDHGDPAPKVP